MVCIFAPKACFDHLVQLVPLGLTPATAFKLVPNLARERTLVV